MALAGILLGAALPLRAGTIRGQVMAVPPEGAVQRRDPVYAREFAKAKFVKYGPVAEVVVAVAGPGGKGGAPRTWRISQRDAKFSPDFLVIAAGDTVEFPNDDRITHNAFSYSPAKQFDLGLYPRGQKKTVTFDRAGVVDVFCAIHENMSAKILVLDTPWFAVTDKKGHFEITGVPAGTATLTTWHPRFPPATREVAVPDGEQAVPVELRMTLGALPRVP